MGEGKKQSIPLRVIKQPALQKNLPQNNELREYLEGKDETTKTPLLRKAPELKPFAAGARPGGEVLLVMPSTSMFEGAVKRAIPPLGLSYIAANLIKHGYTVDILDCIIEGYHTEIELAPGLYRVGISEHEFAEYIRHSPHSIIGFSMIYSSDLPNLYRFAEIVKQIAPEKIVIAGGMHASIYPKQFLSDAGYVDDVPAIDFVIRGEGEYRLMDFVDHARKGVFDIHADGLAGWYNGEIFVNPQYSQIEDLDSLPFPAYEKLPLEKYFEYNVPFSPYPHGKRVMQIYTSRGCPVGCTFCSSTNFNKAYRARSVANVIAEVRYFQDHYGIDEIQFADDNLTFNRKRSIDLFTELKQLNIPWCTPNGIMINTLNKEVVDAMVHSGLYQITLSLDSGNAETLKKRHRKPVNLQRVPELMDYLVALKVLIHGTLVVGMPGESVTDIKKGFDYVKQLPFSSINVFIAQALPGSELFEKSMQSGAIDFSASLNIDTAKSTLELTDLDARTLERLVEEFLSEYNKIIYQNDPITWHRKYKNHKNRLAEICVGTASANTSTIIAAMEHG